MMVMVMVMVMVMMMMMVVMPTGFLALRFRAFRGFGWFVQFDPERGVHHPQRPDLVDRASGDPDRLVGGEGYVLLQRVGTGGELRSCRHLRTAHTLVVGEAERQQDLVGARRSIAEPHDIAIVEFDQAVGDGVGGRLGETEQLAERHIQRELRMVPVARQALFEPGTDQRLHPPDAAALPFGVGAIRQIFGLE